MRMQTRKFYFSVAEIEKNLNHTQKYLKSSKTKLDSIETKLKKAQEALKMINDLPQDLREKYIKIMQAKISALKNH